MNTDQLISQLQERLVPVRKLVAAPLVFLIWVCASVAYVVLLTALLGPFRPGFAEQLLHYPRYSVEMLSGLLAMFCFAYAALTESLPGTNSYRLRFWAWTLALLWIVQIVSSMFYPVLEPSMIGKREHCAWEAYVLSVPPLLAIIWLQRHRFALRPFRAVTLAAFAAGLIPAVIMQVACMYEPVHMLQYHLLPVVILALMTAPVARLLLR